MNSLYLDLLHHSWWRELQQEAELAVSTHPAHRLRSAASYHMSRAGDRRDPLLALSTDGLAEGVAVLLEQMAEEVIAELEAQRHVFNGGATVWRRYSPETAVALSETCVASAVFVRSSSWRRASRDTQVTTPKVAKSPVQNRA
jgi:hypothetical protein